MLASRRHLDSRHSVATMIWLIMLAVLGEATAQTPLQTAQALRSQIMNAYNTGQGTVTIAPGDYEVAAGSANTILSLPGLSNFTINATGVRLIAKELKQVVRFADANNLTVNGLAIDYDPLPFTQGTVTRVSSSSFDVRIHDGYQLAAGAPRVIAYDPQTRRVKDGTATRYDVGLSNLGNGSFRLTRGVQDALAVGDFVSLTLPTLIPHGMLLENSTNVTLQDVRVHASTSFGVFERGGGSNSYNNLKVIPGPTPAGATQPRLLSANADGFHSKHAAVGPTVLGAHIAAQGDDGIAINTDFHLVGAANGFELQVGAKNGSLSFQVGDRIRGYNRTTGAIADAIVQSITRDASLDSGLASIQSTYLPAARSDLDTGFRLTLNQSLALNPGDLISSPDRNGSGYQVRDSLIENHRARGMLLKASNGIVENNTVDGSTIGGIVLLAEPTTWQEAGFSENVAVRGNTVRNTGRQFGGSSNTEGGGIVIAASDGWVGRHHSNIVVENNVLDNIAGPGLIVSFANGVQVTSNHFVNTQQVNTGSGSAVGIDNTAVVWINEAQAVSLSGNTARNLGPLADNLVRVTIATSGLSGRDTGVRLIHDAPAMVIADYRDDFQTSSPAAGWQYLWNSDGAVGNPSNYDPLVSTGGDYTSDGSPAPTADPAARFARLGKNNGHAGTGVNQSGSGGIGRAVIAAYTVGSNGDYAIRDSFVMSNTNGSGLDLTVHVNNDAPLHGDFIESGATASFDVLLADLSAGDTIYVTFGPGDFSTNDFFTLDFSVALLVPPGDFNLDGRVDTADYTVWRDSRGQSGVGLAADITGADLQGIPDGVVDDSDYALWLANFGSSVIGGVLAASSVPEPRSVVMAIAPLLYCWMRCRSRARIGGTDPTTHYRCSRVLALLTLGGVLTANAAPVATAAGITPSSSRGSAEVFDLQSFVDEAVSRGESTIVLPPGRHRVAPSRGVHLRLHALRDVAIVADGVEIVCTQTTRAIQIEDCHRVTLSGLSIDYDPLPYTQGRIVKLSADKRIHEINILDGYPDARTATANKYQVFRRDDHSLRWVDYFDPKVEALTPSRLRVTKQQRDPASEEKVGDLVVIGSSTDVEKTLPHAVVLHSCSGVRLERVTVYASNCFAFLENDCDRNVYLQCRVAKRAVEDDPVRRATARLRSANADGFHSKRATVGPQIVGCYAHYQGDDCVNINGDYHLVTRATGERLRIVAKHSMDIRAGDPVELTDRAGAVLPKARVVSIREVGALTPADRAVVASLDLQSSLKGRLGAVYDVVLNREAILESGSLIAASNRRGDGFTVAECDFGHVRSRGIIAKASHGEIRDNHLTFCRAESIKLAAELYWLESGSASNVQILRNTISDCGSVAIAVYAKGSARGFANGSAHRQITISDNHISRSPLPTVFVSSTDTVRVERNQSHECSEALPSSHALVRSLADQRSATSPILLRHCTEVVMKANTIQ